MLKLLQAFFGKTDSGGYPEALIKQAIERAVDGTDPCLRAVYGYRKKLRSAVIRAIDHVVAMVDAMPPPISVRIAGYSDDPILRSYFISAKELQDFLCKDRSLGEFLSGEAEGSCKVIALLAMERQERGVFGAALSGEIVIRDVPMVTVSFDGHRLIDPGIDEGVIRRALKIRAFDHLLGLALKRLAFVKTERSELERHRTLLQAKLDLFARHGLGFDPSASGGQTSPAELEKQLEQIEAELNDIGGDAGEYKTYLQTVAEVIGNPEQYLLAKTETIFVNQLGVKQNEAASDVRELTFTELRNAEGRSLVVMLIDLGMEELRHLIPVKT